MFGLPVAVLIAGVLVAFEPNLLAHGALVTTDVAAALGMALAIYATYHYVREPRATRLLPLGLAVGLALCAKHSSILLAVIVPALLFADAIFYSSASNALALFCAMRGRPVLVAAIGSWCCGRLTDSAMQRDPAARLSGFRPGSPKRAARLPPSDSCNRTLATSARRLTWLACRMCWSSPRSDGHRSCWASSIATATGFIFRSLRPSSSRCRYLLMAVAVGYLCPFLAKQISES